MIVTQRNSLTTLLYFMVVVLFFFCISSAQALEIDFDIDIDSSQSLDPALKDQLATALKAHRDSHTLYKHYTQARKFALADQQYLTAWLESRGYFDAQVDFNIKRAGAAEENDKKIIFIINPGEVYRIEKIAIEGQPYMNLPELDDLDLAVGDPLAADPVLNAKQTITDYIDENNCLFKVKVNYEAAIIKNSHQAVVNFKVLESPEVSYGTITWDGLETVKNSVITEALIIKKGGCFARKELDKQRLEFLQTNLLAQVEQKLKLNEATEQVDVHFSFTENQHKTVKAGIAFTSDEGVSVTGGWENRNMYGHGERLTLEGKLGSQGQTLNGELVFPNFYSTKNTFIINGSLKNEKLEAYEAKSLELGAHLERELTERSKLTAGLQLKRSEIDRDGVVEKFSLLSIPMLYEIDTTKNPLDPRSGGKLQWGIEPFANLSDTDNSFIKLHSSVAGYKTLESITWQPTLAARFATGSILGVSLSDDVPADELFFVGGGGSVRGYPYQSLGPLRLNNKPNGGLSFAETSFETRFHITEQYGFALFTEGGSAFADTSPKFNSDWRWAVGLGFRYYTSFAPMRVDLAFPMNKRDGIDDGFQLYISIGEAF